MTTTLFIERDAHFSDREAVNAASSPSAYDAAQFYAGGAFIGSTAGGNAFTIPAGLTIGWKCRFFRDVGAGAMTIALDGSYASSRPLGMSFPVSLQEGGFIDLEIIGTNRFGVGAYQGVAFAATLASVATRTDLSTISAANRYHGMEVTVRSDNSRWAFNSAATFAADYTGTVAIPLGAVTAANLVIVPAAGTGRWVRVDTSFIARIPFVQATADAAILWTPPSGIVVRITGLPFWNITAFTAGNGARRIGVSSSSADGEFTVQGDLLGGAGGQLPVLGVTTGTVGAAFSTSDTANTSLATIAKMLMPLAAGIANIRYDVVAAGTDTADGMICIPVSVNTTVATIS